MKGLASPRERWAWVGAWALAAFAIGALAWIAGADLEDEGRARLVRYIGILTSAAMAIGVPHVLFPDPRRRALQLANASPSRLRWRQASRWMPVPLVLAVPALVIGRGEVAAEGVIASVAVGAFALGRASGLGPRSRAWESLEAGGWYRRLYTWAPPVRFLVPDPLVPGILLTGEVFLLGSVLSIAGQAGGLGFVLPLAGLAGIDILFRWSGEAGFDRAYWTSNAVWADAFRQTDSAEAREPVAYDSIYWAPSRVRPSVWAGLVSLDRRFPLGRVATVGLALIAATYLADGAGGLRAAAVALYIVVMNGAIALTVGVVPSALEARLGGAGRWSLARFLMNVRWLPPLVAVGLLLMWLSGLEGATLAVWAVVDLAVAALSAVLVTVVARFRFRRALA